MLLVIATLLALFILVWRWPFHHPFEGAASYPPLHIILETIAIAVAALVSGVAWNAYGRERAGNVIVLACGMLAVAILGLLHLLSYTGMPDFFGPSGSEKAIYFWLVARYWAAATILVVAVRPWRPFGHPHMRYILMAGSMALLAVLAWIGLFRQAELPHTFVPGQGLTPLKIWAEYGVIAILVVAGVLFLRRSRRAEPYDAPSLAGAVAVSILSELCFTLYTDVTDIFNLLGHVYLVIAYVFIYRAVFAASVRDPFGRAISAAAETRELFAATPMPIWDEDLSAIAAYLRRLPRDDINDLSAYLLAHPEVLRDCAELVRVIELNDASLAFLGAAGREEMLASSPWLASPGTLDLLRRELVAIWNGETRMLTEALVTTRSGVVRQATISWAVAPGHEALLDRVTVAAIDTTEQRRAERLLRQEIDRDHLLLDLYHRAQTLSEQELCELAVERVIALTGSSIGLFLLVSADEAVVDLTTWGADAADGCTVGATRRHELSSTGVWADCVRSGGPVVMNDYAGSSNRMGLPDGHVPLDRFAGVPVLADGRVRYILGVGNKVDPYEDRDVVGLQLVANEVHKILAQRDAERALRTIDLQYRRFVEDDVAGVLVTTLQHRPLACNPALARMFGFSSVEDALAAAEIHLHESASDREAFLAELREHGRIEEREVTLQRVDGSPIDCLQTVIADTDEHGDVVAIRGYLVDITERKALEVQLRDAQKMEAIGRLAGGIAHDFNNLLTAINGYSALLASDMAPGDPGRQDVDEIGKAGARAAALTRQLLAFGRRQVLAPKVIDLNEIVVGITPMLRRLIGENIELRSRLSPQLGCVRADPSQVEQVILNLVVNARDAMPGGGTVTIETANVEVTGEDLSARARIPAGAFVTLMVSDTGTGFDPAATSHMFEPFYTTKAPGEGTGLGLATVDGIVAQSGGHIEVGSAPGHGAALTVFLPRVLDAPTPSPGVTGPAPLAGKGSILLVEDEEVVRALVKRVLGGLGYTVRTAGSGAEALALADDGLGPIDLLVTDVLLPGITGLELSGRLTARDPLMRTLFISGYGMQEILPWGVLEPGMAFLAKPFEREELGRAVADALQPRP
ncbi:MAG: MASE3 domain-containing protein [Chloroflexota bacterium]